MLLRLTFTPSGKHFITYVEKAQKRTAATDGQRAPHGRDTNPGLNRRRNRQPSFSVARQSGDSVFQKILQRNFSMQKKHWLATIRSVLLQNSQPDTANLRASFARRRRSRNPGSITPMLLSDATAFPVEYLEDRTLLSVTATLNGQQLEITLGANNDHAFISFNGGLKVGTTASGTDVFSGSLAQTISSIAILQTASTSGQQVTFSGSNPISGSDGTAASGLSSISIAAGITTVNLQQVLNASSVAGSATTVNLASTGRLQTAVHLAASSGATIAVAAADYTGEGTVAVSSKTITITGPQASTSPNSTPASWTTNSALA
ncbi:MAG TPA: hypothetical protein DIT89_07705, partial [Planctomycetaceae bacterium]|nr:hypothetical protein [Planctomycetaceae bacterium]